ncbi:hypothetical protein PUN28_019934 [Cardiocondyla obscurior]|uniref:Uncharacterized protein n=1 Tax=Cardiocondyla obscurior TaxID=286306 RepID=A0AAW2EDY3_9HYME
MYTNAYVWQSSRGNCERSANKRTRRFNKRTRSDRASGDFLRAYANVISHRGILSRGKIRRGMRAFATVTRGNTSAFLRSGLTPRPRELGHFVRVEARRYQFAVNQYREIRSAARDGTKRRAGWERERRQRGGEGGGLYLIYLSQLRPQISGRGGSRGTTVFGQRGRKVGEKE